MTDAQPSSRLDRIEVILAEMAASQQQSQQASAERFSRIEATLDRVASQQEENNRANELLRQRIEQNSAANAELQRSITSFRQENAKANAEMRRSITEGLAETRQEIKTNIDDVSAMIFDGLSESKKLTDSNARAIQAWEQRLETEREQTIGVEVDTLNAIQTLQSGQDGIRSDVQTLTHFVRDGFNMLGQAIVVLRQELSAQIQNLIDITRDNTGRITRLENEDHH